MLVSWIFEWSCSRRYTGFNFGTTRNKTSAYNLAGRDTIPMQSVEVPSRISLVGENVLFSQHLPNYDLLNFGVLHITATVVLEQLPF